MWFVTRRVIGALVFVFNTLVPGPTHARQMPGVVDDVARQMPSVVQDIGQRPFIQRPIPKGGRKGSLRFARTELYFGTARPDGAITDEEFQAFIDREVTSRFPAGLTVVKAEGQFWAEDGTLVKEQSYILILLYPYETFSKATTRVEQIRNLYKDRFDQQSVLRVDAPFVVWVSF
jgi:hypothetical protein